MATDLWTGPGFCLSDLPWDWPGSMSDVKVEGQVAERWRVWNPDWPQIGPPNMENVSGK